MRQTEPTADDPALARALDGVVEELTRVRAAESAARAQHDTLRARRGELAAAAGRLIALLPEGERGAWQHRLGVADGAKARAERVKRRPADTRMAEVYRFLTLVRGDVFRTVSLTAWLEDEGFELPPTYAANACRNLSRAGLLTRTGWGVYTINRRHPLMVRVQLDVLSALAKEG
ncbi:MAG: hypothetical protein ACFBWO_18210 [Paracoccaceae bacterium]